MVTQVALLTAGCVWLGSLLDGVLGSSPWLLFVGAAGGFAAGITRLFAALHRLDASDDDPQDHSS